MNAIERLRDWVEVTERSAVRVRRNRTWVHQTEAHEALAAVEALYEAAKSMSEFLENEKETHEPPRELLDKGYVAMERSIDYEREEELGHALAAAVRRVEGE